MAAGNACSVLCASLLVAAVCSTIAGEHAAVQHSRGLIHLYRAKPADLTIYWQSAEGKPLRTFDAVMEQLKGQTKRPVFLMNGGIFESGGIPTGLHIENGKELRPLNLADGKGNFFLKPNGVFFIDAEGAHIVESEAYAGMKVQPRLALQSGPMLLTNGKIHPAFRAGSKNLLHRNGVGLLADGRVLFVMTDLSSGTRVNLYQFAMIFRQYGCRDALFLDGDLSMMRIDDGEQVVPVDARDPSKRELLPGMPIGSEFGAIIGEVMAVEARRER